MSDTAALAAALPKLAEQALGSLPKLTDEDQKEIRSFLPGKLLARTAALLSLALLVLGFVVAGNYGLRQLGIDLAYAALAWLCPGWTTGGRNPVADRR